MPVTNSGFSVSKVLAVAISLEVTIRIKSNLKVSRVTSKVNKKKKARCEKKRWQY